MERPKTSIPLFPHDDSFIFKQRSGNLNWREIQNLDLDEIIHKGDVEKISEILENITYASIDKTDLERFPDTFIIKLLRISQFALEFLQEKDRKLKEENHELNQEKNIITQTSKELEEKIQGHIKIKDSLSRQLTHKTKTLSTYEYLLKQPATKSFVDRAVNKDSIAKCEECGKAFKSHNYLASHLERRHAALRPSTAPVANIESLRTTFEEQFNSIKEQHFRELSEFKSTMQEQFLSFKSRPVEPLDLKEQPTDLNFHRDIEAENKELIKTRLEQKRNRHLLKQKEEEILRLERENKQLEDSKMKLEYKIKNAKASKRSKKKSISMGDTLTQLKEDKKERQYSEYGEIFSAFKDLESENSYVKTEKKEEIFKLEEYNLHSERISPSFREVADSNKYIKPLNNPETGDILEAAKILGIDPVKETQYLYLARDLLKSPIPKSWTATNHEEKVAFKHKENGEIRETHPGIDYFQNLYKSKKLRLSSMNDKIKVIIANTKQKYMENDEISALFQHEKNSIDSQKKLLMEKIQAALDKMKNISNIQLSKINEEREKLFNKNGIEFRRANEVINSELLLIFNKIKK